MPKLNLDELSKNQKEVFEIRLGGKEYRLPLAKDLTFKQYESLAEAQEKADVKSMISFLSQFMGKEVAENLPLDFIKAIFEGWGRASNGETGDLSSGES